MSISDVNFDNSVFESFCWLAELLPPYDGNKALGLVFYAKLNKF